MNKENQLGGAFGVVDVSAFSKLYSRYIEKLTESDRKDFRLAFFSRNDLVITIGNETFLPNRSKYFREDTELISMLMCGSGSEKFLRHLFSTSGVIALHENITSEKQSEFLIRRRRANDNSPIQTVIPASLQSTTKLSVEDWSLSEIMANIGGSEDDLDAISQKLQASQFFLGAPLVNIKKFSRIDFQNFDMQGKGKDTTGNLVSYLFPKELSPSIYDLLSQFGFLQISGKLFELTDDDAIIFIRPDSFSNIAFSLTTDSKDTDKIKLYFSQSPKDDVPCSQASVGAASLYLSISGAEGLLEQLKSEITILSLSTDTVHLIHRYKKIVSGLEDAIREFYIKEGKLSNIEAGMVVFGKNRYDTQQMPFDNNNYFLTCKAIYDTSLFSANLKNYSYEEILSLIYELTKNPNSLKINCTTGQIILDGNLFENTEIRLFERADSVSGEKRKTIALQKGKRFNFTTNIKDLFTEENRKILESIYTAESIAAIELRLELENGKDLIKLSENLERRNNKDGKNVD